jgi:hypothetical protein
MAKLGRSAGVTGSSGPCLSDRTRSQPTQNPFFDATTNKHPSEVGPNRTVMFSLPPNGISIKKYLEHSRDGTRHRHGVIILRIVQETSMSDRQVLVPVGTVFSTAFDLLEPTMIWYGRAAAVPISETVPRPPLHPHVLRVFVTLAAQVASVWRQTFIEMTSATRQKSDAFTEAKQDVEHALASNYMYSWPMHWSLLAIYCLAIPFPFPRLLLANAPIARLCGKQERVRELAGEQARAGLG